MKQRVIIIAIAVVLCVCLCIANPQMNTGPAPEPAPEVEIGKVPPEAKSIYDLSIFYDGKLYEGMGFGRSVTKGTVPVGTVTEVTETPDSDLEASYGEVGRNVYLWMEDGILWLGVEITESDQLKYWDEPHAFALEIGRDEEEIERIERRKKWFSVY